MKNICIYPKHRISKGKEGMRLIMKKDFKTRALIGTIIISIILIGCLIYKMNQNEEQCATQKSSSYDISFINFAFLVEIFGIFA